MVRKGGRSGVLTLLLPGDPPEIFGGNRQQVFELAHAVLADVPRLISGPRFLKEPGRLLMVRRCHIKGVFKGGLVESFVIHSTSVVPFPG